MLANLRGALEHMCCVLLMFLLAGLGSCHGTTRLPSFVGGIVVYHLRSISNELTRSIILRIYLLILSFNVSFSTTLWFRFSIVDIIIYLLNCLEFFTRVEIIISVFTQKWVVTALKLIIFGNLTCFLMRTYLISEYWSTTVIPMEVISQRTWYRRWFKEHLCLWSIPSLRSFHYL